MILPAIGAAVSALVLAAGSAQAGPVFLTGHDPDFHAHGAHCAGVCEDHRGRFLCHGLDQAKPAALGQSLHGASGGSVVDGSGDVSQLNGTTQLTLVSDTETYVTDTFLAAYKNAGAVAKARQLAAASFPSAVASSIHCSPKPLHHTRHECIARRIRRSLRGTDPS